MKKKTKKKTALVHLQEILVHPQNQSQNLNLSRGQQPVAGKYNACAIYEYHFENRMVGYSLT